MQTKTKRYGYVERKKVAFIFLKFYYVKKSTFGSGLYIVYSCVYPRYAALRPYMQLFLPNLLIFGRTSPPVLSVAIIRSKGVSKLIQPNLVT